MQYCPPEIRYQADRDHAELVARYSQSESPLAHQLLVKSAETTVVNRYITSHGCKPVLRPIFVY